MKTILLVTWTVIAACAANPAPPALDEPTTSMATSEVTNACANQCNTASIQCFATCDRFPNPNCESRCDQRFANCMQACGCPFNSEFDRVTFDHAVAVNTFVCIGPLNHAGVYYQQYNEFQRTDHVRETLQCDGLTTQTVLSSTVSPAGPCLVRLFPDVSCPISQLPSPGICPF
jgi:hypothetical protein